MPKISVMTPVYNTNPEHLRAMIESVLGQTFTDFEFIILNDSPENKELKEIIKSYDDPRIVYAENERNIGISESRNRLLEMSRGEYLAVCDHDDISMPDRFALQSEFLDNNPKVGVVGAQFKYFDSDLQYTSAHPESNYKIKLLLLKGCCVAHPASMIRKSVLIQSGVRYEQRYSPAEDYMLWCRLMEWTSFHNMPDILLDYRHHENMTSMTQKEQQFAAMHEILFYVQNKYPAWVEKELRKTPKRILIFGIIPLLKIHYAKNRTNKQWVKLFNIIPILKIKR
ncbi:MAG: glycosyltransferase [Rickettsiales bacterium]|jgi:glycosyltransferase involved in cell wall biosynthesis|nr:glycosyltransferase [Rickettsiales bacterium]